MKHAAGFTLVELLIALALTGIVTLLILGGTRFTAAGLNRTAATAERLETQRSLQQLLRRELSSAMVVPALPGEPPLTGRPDAVDFFGLAEDGGAGLFRISIAAEAGTGSRSLTMSRRRAGDPTAAAQRTVLVPHIGGFAIAYFGRMSSDDAPGWHERWERLPYLPTLVRITFDGINAPLVVRIWASG
jgi:general secretion pathway protein J